MPQMGPFEGTVVKILPQFAKAVDRVVEELMDDDDVFDTVFELIIQDHPEWSQLDPSDTFFDKEPYLTIETDYYDRLTFRALKAMANPRADRLYKRAFEEHRAKKDAPPVDRESIIG